MIEILPVTSTRLKTDIATLAKRYDCINITGIGLSRLGRPIYALTIGHGERAIMYNAAHHANEWITTLVLMKFIEECAQAYENNTFPNDVMLHAIPLVNPDGVDLVTGEIGRLRLAYKDAEKMANKSKIHLQTELTAQAFPACWKANICGVDLNSNYPAGWELARAYKFALGYNQPGPRDYVGEAPLSEPESCAMVAYTSINDFELTMSLHTQGEVIYWRYKDYNPPKAEEIVKRLSKASGYVTEDVPSESSHAGYRDWFIETFNRPGFTIECGFGENPLPISQFTDIYNKVKPLLWEGLV